MKKAINFTLVFIFSFILLGLFISPKIVKADDIPEINFVGIEHSPLVEGDTESFYITSQNVYKVQYRVILDDNYDLTNGYTDFTYAKIPYKVTSGYRYSLGHHKLVIWVRAIGSTAEYDNTYEVGLNCVNRDDSQRVYTDGDMITDKNTYTLGDKVQIKGISNIRGMGGGYTYKIHLYDPIADEWTTDVTDYGDLAEWRPDKPGVYVIDLWAMSYNSPLWQYIDKDSSTEYYEGWRLKVISVGGNTISNIANINVTVPQNSTYKLPDKVDAEMADGSISKVQVSWNKNTVTTTKTGTFIYTGTVQGYSGTVSLTLTVKATITNIQDITATINQYDPFNLPSTVTAYLSDGSQSILPVTWTPSTVDTSKAGTATFSGKVDGYSKGVKLTLTINAVTLNINNMIQTVNQYDSYTLPSTLTATAQNGRTVTVSVTWSPNTVNTSIPGIYSFSGTAANYTTPISLTLNVTDIHLVMDAIQPITIQRYGSISLPSQLHGTGTSASGSSISVYVPVTWDQSSIDTSTPGTLIVHGHVRGYTNSSGTDEVTISIIIS